MGSLQEEGEMNLHYRLGWPLGRFLARWGVPTTIRLDINHDEEANVFVGTSTDLPGLRVEASTYEDAAREATLRVPDLLRAAGVCRQDAPADFERSL